MTDEADDVLLNTAEAAELLGVDSRVVLRRAKAGALTSIRTLGGQHRFREAEVRALLAGLPGEGQ